MDHAHEFTSHEITLRLGNSNSVTVTPSSTKCVPLLDRAEAPWPQFSEAIEGDGAQVWRVACDMGLEGIVSSRSPYISGRFDGWRKSKCTETQLFAVLAYDRQGRSLRLARLVDCELVACGSAGSGLSDADARQGEVSMLIGLRNHRITPATTDLYLVRSRRLAGRSPKVGQLI